MENTYWTHLLILMQIRTLSSIVTLKHNLVPYSIQRSKRRAAPARPCRPRDNPNREVCEVLVTALRLRVSMGGDDHILLSGSFQRWRLLRLPTPAPPRLQRPVR
ncbi:hypothetical protein EVAR_30556_1 [Eumeta japonica]|uniref:Uncharacterized protein n=1 Tax=Eumeta variegata TaxID=151549 RepID=A0A4C1VQ75_EUMVA|nr:hypothetical protein EVAR_30556_1 [Eumeta japonica]